MTNILKKVYHISAFFWYAFIIQCIYAKEETDLPPGLFVYGGPWKYLTFLNLVKCVPCEIYEDLRCVGLQLYCSVEHLNCVCFLGFTDGVFWIGIPQ